MNNVEVQTRNSCRVDDLGLIEYAKALEIQKRCVGEVASGGVQRLLLCEHPPVITLGRLAKRGNIFLSDNDLAGKGFQLYAVDRGGDVTLHAPGQLVVYPILDLRALGGDLHAYLHKLEQVAVDLLSNFGIVAHRIFGKTGVWAGENKIASVGIGVKKWISYHGLALNINTDLTSFFVMRPCGMEVEMTSLARLKGQTIDMAFVKSKMTECFMRSFDLVPCKARGNF
jgi:lipoate-protein ligase B